MPLPVSRAHLGLGLAVALGALVSGCVADGLDVAAEPSLEAVEYVGPSGPETHVFGLDTEPVTVPGSPCACTTEACVEDYIREHLGCGSCYGFRCEDGRRVCACVQCAP